MELCQGLTAPQECKLVAADFSGHVHTSRLRQRQKAVLGFSRRATKTALSAAAEGFSSAGSWDLMRQAEGLRVPWQPHNSVGQLGE